LSRDDAIALAQSRGLSLVAWWPAADEDDGPVWCTLGKVARPVRWERAPDPALEPDPRLWFEAKWCGGRDFLFHVGAHTFLGRMMAWCPDRAQSYRVSLDEMGVMSDEAKYFVLGFLAGNEPPPPNDSSDIADPDQTAWRMATARFRLTGSWYGRWGTCAVCGCVLLPDSSEELCHEHRPQAPE
jgi:hypothetical protein